MDNKYILPNFDTEKFKGWLNLESRGKPQKIETIDFLFDGLNLSLDTIKNKDLFLRNYIYSTIIARKHLLEIDNRIKHIKQKKNSIVDKESYAFRKLKYFEKKNENAKEQIINFLCYRLIYYISNRNADLINRNKQENMWLIGPTYDYQYNSQYYNPDYDFSTFTKFYDIPNVPFNEFLKNIKEMISLKKSSLENYQLKVIDTVEKNDLLSKMVERVSCNYHMHQRKEIFESLLELFNDKKYLTFVVNAAMQLEGMFYELVSIKYGAKENQGTLVEKVEKAFEKNEILKHTLYPYFSFDIPNLRNQAAHKGIVKNKNIEVLAYELILDLNCLVTLVEKESIDKFKIVLIIRDKLNEIGSNNYKKEEDYNRVLSNKLFGELFMNNMISSAYFWELITKPENFDEELNYYIPENKDEKFIYLKDVVYALSNLIKKEDFWKVVLEACEEITIIDNTKIDDLGAFIEELKNMFIPRLEGEAKKVCCQINKKLLELKNPKKGT